MILKMKEPMMDNVNLDNIFNRNLFKIKYICLKIMNKKFTVLYLEFEDVILNDNELLNMYKNRIQKHNNSVVNDLYPDSGFDLLTPNIQNNDFNSNQIKLIPMGIKCSAFTFLTKGKNEIPQYDVVQLSYEKGLLFDNTSPQPFVIHPRSSIWKSGFRLANSTGIIDSGYRGTIMTALHNVTSEPVHAVYKNRYVQICMPNLEPFFIEVVDNIKIDSNRGSGGIGSTGN